MAETPETFTKPDFRIYIGMMFFRWQIIAVCFLYCLLGGVVYLHVTPKEYQVSATLMIHSESQLHIPGEWKPWSGLKTHVYLLQSPELRGLVYDSLKDEWRDKVGAEKNPLLRVRAHRASGLGPTLWIETKTRTPGYGLAFLRVLIAEHEKEWKSIQAQARESAAGLLEEELVKLEEKIDAAEDAIIEYQRLHDIARVSARGAMESAYLSGLMGRKNALITEQMMIDAQYEAAKNEDAVVISEVNKLTRETGRVRPVRVRRSSLRAGFEEEEEVDDDENTAGLTEIAELRSPGSDLSLDDDEGGREYYDGLGWQELRVSLIQLEYQKDGLAKNLKPGHPRLASLANRIASIKKRLNVAKAIELRRMEDRQTALRIQLDAIEAAEYKWQAKDLLAAKRRAEMKRIGSRVGRFEKNYNVLYSRLHTMRVTEELKGEQFRVVRPPKATSRPTWPDPMKILLMALTMGLGSGFGIALVLQVLDNKVQTIKDVEQELGIPFLGGIPFWVHSGLEKSIRPIVTEEHASGATEAYRALRTLTIAALQKTNEKIMLVTSADSREGKTLTSLNLAIVMAQMNKRVLLMDMDLRRGRLHRSLGLDREPGISDVLGEGRSLKEVIQRTRIENLYFAPTGSSVDDSAELLQSSDIVSLYVDVQDDYDYIVCDTSPVLRATDTVILATHGMGVVAYVARVNHTPKPLIRYSLDMLEDARVLGLIMNSIEMHKISSLYYTYQYPNYAYYSNAYAYGYDYYRFEDGTKAGRRATRRAAWHSRAHAARRWFRRTFLPLE